MIFIVIVPFILLPFIEKMSFKNCLYLLSSLSLSFLWTYKQTALVKVTSDFHATKIQWSHQGVPLLGISPKGVEAGTWRDVCRVKHYSSESKGETTSGFINRWMDKQDVYPDNGILFSLRKEGNSDTCCNMTESWRHAKWSKSDTDGQVWYDSTYMRYLEQWNTQRQSRMVVAKGWGRGSGEFLFNRYRVSFGRWESSGGGWWWW